MAKSDQHHRIDYVELPTTNIQRLKDFYGQAFGWQFQDWGESYASFADGRLNGGFRLEDSVTPGGVLVILYSQNLEETRDGVISAGGTLDVDIFSFPGGRRFQFSDPEGNQLAVWSEP